MSTVVPSLTFSITPGGPISGDIEMPGDKSISHRAILLSAITHQTVDIHNISLGSDVLASIEAMRTLGVSISLDAEKKIARVEGVGLYGLQAPQKPIDCGNAGTLMRLLAGILVGQQFDSILMGDASLSQRPMLRIAAPLRLMGAKITLSENNTAPIEIKGNQPLQGIDYELPVPSAQVKSAILLAGLYAEGETKVYETILTRDHTERMLLGARAHRHIPGDISAAAFFIVLATITKNSTLMIRNVGINPFRTGIITILKLMGAHIEIQNERFFEHEPVADILVKSAELTGIVIPEEMIASAIDEFPIIFVAAACAKGKTVLRNATELRVKESDRIAVMAENLRKLHIVVTEFDDGLEIQGGGVFSGAILDAKGDHRVAMALSIAAHIAQAPISIKNCEFVATSFPNFTELCRVLGVAITS